MWLEHLLFGGFDQTQAFRECVLCRYFGLYFTGLFDIYGVRGRDSGMKFTDNTERENEVKKIEIKSLYQTKRESIRKVCCGTISRQREE